MGRWVRNVCTGLPLPPGNALSAGTEGHLIPMGGSVCGVGAVLGRVLFGRGGQSRENGPSRLPAGYLLVTMVAKVTLLGSVESIGVVSEECSHGVAGGLEGRSR